MRVRGLIRFLEEINPSNRVPVDRAPDSLFLREPSNPFSDDDAPDRSEAAINSVSTRRMDRVTASSRQ